MLNILSAGTQRKLNLVIPGVGEFQPCFDHVKIVSSRPVPCLRYSLPIKELATVSHSFHVFRHTGPNPRFRSDMILVCAQDLAPVNLLLAHESVLATYSITAAELAFDSVGGDPHEALRALVRTLGKFRHQRGYLIREGGTYYFVDRKAGVALKAYVRRRKLPSGALGEEHLRIEFTLNKKGAITRHLDGNQLINLWTADPCDFLERNLRLEEVNYAALARLFGIKWPNWRKVMLMLRHLAYSNEMPVDGLCLQSPAMIRGYLKGLQLN